MIEQIQRVITNIVERVGTQGAAKESLGTASFYNTRREREESAWFYGIEEYSNEV